MSRNIFRKAHNESASKIGQFMHDTQPRDHDCIDVDYLAWKSERKCLRFIEEKLAGERISRSQERVLPVLAKLVQLGIKSGDLSADSGVFVVWWWQSDDSDIQDEHGNYVAKMKVQRVTHGGLQKMSDLVPFEDVLRLVNGSKMPDLENLRTEEATDGR
jgi:hypothetical protein